MAIGTVELGGIQKHFFKTNISHYSEFCMYQMYKLIGGITNISSRILL